MYYKIRSILSVLCSNETERKSFSAGEEKRSIFVFVGPDFGLENYISVRLIISSHTGVCIVQMTHKSRVQKMLYSIIFKPRRFHKKSRRHSLLDIDGVIEVSLAEKYDVYMLPARIVYSRRNIGNLHRDKHEDTKQFIFACDV